MKRLEGKKTYISVAVLIIGLIGAGDFITESDVSGLINAAMQIIGIVGAIYGRYDASRRYKRELVGK